MKLLSQLSLALLATLPVCGAAEDLSCTTDEALEGGASSGYSAKISIVGKKISALKVETYNASGEEGGAYFCTLDTTDADSKVTWSASGADTKLSIETLGETSEVAISHKGNAYVLDLTQVKRVYCGFGAEWPASITVTPKKKACTAVK